MICLKADGKQVTLTWSWYWKYLRRATVTSTAIVPSHQHSTLPSDGSAMHHLSDYPSFRRDSESRTAPRDAWSPARNRRSISAFQSWRRTPAKLSTHISWPLPSCLDRGSQSYLYRTNVQVANTCPACRASFNQVDISDTIEGNLPASVAGDWQ